MRIRKQLHTPSLAPPFESLHHHQPPSDPPIQPLPAPPRSDLQLTLVRGNNGWICKTDDDCMHYNASTQVGDDMIGKLSTAPAVHVSDDNSSSAIHAVGISSFESSAQLDKKWCNGEMESAVKSNRKVEKEHVQETEMVEDGENMNKMIKKSDKESTITEGSRCSRVNGRKWRCWKQAVVGYSLCAHHSKQGRVRSTTSFKDEKQGHTHELSSSPVLLDEEPLIMLKKRKKKIGMIKNRSISGLLAQTAPQPALPMPLLDYVATS